MSFSIVGRRYSAGSSRRFSPFFSDHFERRGLVYVGASIQHKTAADAVFAEYGFTWDAGNRITEFETVDGTVEYTYDKTGQLIGAEYDYITDELYTYDNNGNRTNAGYVTGENNETLSDGTYRYSYDNEGNRTEKFLWTDSNNDGIIDASEKTLVQTYNWDYRNRLSSVTNYENGIAKEIINYLYDYLNLMIERTVADAATSALQSSDFNIYSNGQVVLEYDTTSSVDIVKSVNLWGANIDELVAVEQIAQSVNDSNVILWTYGDHLNSIRDVLIYDSITQTAAVVNHLIYNAFGILVSSTDGNSVNPASISPFLIFRYTGKFFDDSTGLQNNINRWYDNTTSKWLSVDPIGFKGGDANLYRYVGNGLKLDSRGLLTDKEKLDAQFMFVEDFIAFYEKNYYDDDIVQVYNEFFSKSWNQNGLARYNALHHTFYQPYIKYKSIIDMYNDNDNSILKNKYYPYSGIPGTPQFGNPQLDTPYTSRVVNPYGGFGSNNLSYNSNSNSEGSTPHSINDFNWSNNFDRQKYMVDILPFKLFIPQITIPSDKFTKGFKEHVYDENYRNPGDMNYWNRLKYETDPIISIFDMTYSMSHFDSNFQYFNRGRVLGYELQYFSIKPIVGTNWGLNSNMECQYGNIHIKTNVSLIYSPFIPPFGSGKLYYGGQREDFEIKAGVLMLF